MPRRLILLAILVAGNLALLGAMRGRQFTLVVPFYDPDGSVFSAAPGPDHMVRAGAEHFDYRIGFGSPIELPPRTNGDRGLDDVRAAVRWVRFHLRVGDDFHAETWWLSDILVAASGRSP